MVLSAVSNMTLALTVQQMPKAGEGESEWERRGKAVLAKVRRRSSCFVETCHLTIRKKDRPKGRPGDLTVLKGHLRASLPPVLTELGGQ